MTSGYRYGFWTELRSAFADAITMQGGSPPDEIDDNRIRLKRLEREVTLALEAKVKLEDDGSRLRAEADFWKLRAENENKTALSYLEVITELRKRIEMLHQHPHNATERCVPVEYPEPKPLLAKCVTCGWSGEAWKPWACACPNCQGDLSDGGA